MKAEYIDHMGSDLTVVNAARVSMSKHHTIFDLVSDTKLINFLAGANHWTPFAHPQITLRMNAPIPIRTQCFKHKSGFVENEESRRYISCTPEIYLPDELRMKPEGSIKQGSAGVHPASDDLLAEGNEMFSQALCFYEYLIDEGVCPEQARLWLPQGAEVNWYWTGSLAAFARFVRQRTDSHAQKEIQDLAKMVSEIIEPLFPVSWQALTTETPEPMITREEFVKLYTALLAGEGPEDFVKECGAWHFGKQELRYLTDKVFGSYAS